MLAGSPIRDDLQPHLAVARMAEQPPATTPASLLEGTIFTRLVVGRETAVSPGPCESRCSSKSVSKWSSAASSGKALSAAERCSACPLRADDSEQAAPHIRRAPRAEHGSNIRAARPRRCNLESRRPPARHGTRGSPRTESCFGVSRATESPRLSICPAARTGLRAPHYCSAALADPSGSGAIVPPRPSS